FHAPVAQGVRLIPDGYVELRTFTGMMSAFLEVDLGHEHLSVWKKKINGYLQLALSGDFERHFGHLQFRVLLIVNSERRLLSIRPLVRKATKKIFWFTTIDAIRTNGFFAPIWLRPEGDTRHSFFPNTLTSS